MDARMAQLIQSLLQQQRQKGGTAHGANLSGVGGRALPFAQGIRSPLGIGGFYSAPINFNPVAFGGVGNASLGTSVSAPGSADASGAGIGGVLPTDASPNPGGGASDSSPHYQSDPGAPDPSTPYIAPAAAPSASPAPTGPVLQNNPGPAPAENISNAHYGGSMNLGDPTDPFYYRYLYRNSFGL